MSLEHTLCSSLNEVTCPCGGIGRQLVPCRFRYRTKVIAVSSGNGIYQMVNSRSSIEVSRWLFHTSSGHATDDWFPSLS